MLCDRSPNCVLQGLIDGAGLERRLLTWEHIELDVCWDDGKRKGKLWWCRALDVHNVLETLYRELCSFRGFVDGAGLK